MPRDCSHLSRLVSLNGTTSCRTTCLHTKSDIRRVQGEQTLLLRDERPPMLRYPIKAPLVRCITVTLHGW